MHWNLLPRFCTEIQKWLLSRICVLTNGLCQLYVDFRHLCRATYLYIEIACYMFWEYLSQVSIRLLTFHHAVHHTFKPLDGQHIWNDQTRDFPVALAFIKQFPHSYRYECQSSGHNFVSSVGNHQPSCRTYVAKSSAIQGGFLGRAIFCRQNDNNEYDNIPRAWLRQGENKMQHG